MTPAVMFAVTWRACLPEADADRYCPSDSPQSIGELEARALAGEWLAGTWAQLWRDLAPGDDPERRASAACWQVLTRYGDQVHGPAAFDAVRDVANRALSRTGFIAAATLTDATHEARAEAHARAVLGAVGDNFDPWRPADFPSYEARYGHLLAVGWGHLAATVERGQRAADRLRRQLAGSI